jgi:hypothetical protein
MVEEELICYMSSRKVNLIQWVSMPRSLEDESLNCTWHNLQAWPSSLVPGLGNNDCPSGRQACRQIQASLFQISSPLLCSTNSKVFKNYLHIPKFS